MGGRPAATRRVKRTSRTWSYSGLRDAVVVLVAPLDEVHELALTIGGDHGNGGGAGPDVGGRYRVDARVQVVAPKGAEKVRTKDNNDRKFLHPRGAAGT